MVAKKTSKKEARKAVIANQFGADTIFTRVALYNIVKNNSLFKGTKDNKQLVTNALVTLVREGVLERTGNKRRSMYKLSAEAKQKNRMHRLEQKKVRKMAAKGKPHKTYKPPVVVPLDKTSPQKGLLTGLTSLSVQMIMLQKKIEDTLLSKADNPKEGAELISEYVYIAAQMMQPQ